MSLKRYIPAELHPASLIGPALFAVAVFYLAFHVVNGERGLYAYFKQSRNLEVSHAELAQLTAKREKLERKVMLMSDQSLDKDLLEEQARRLLGMAKESEIILIVEPDGSRK